MFIMASPTTHRYYECNERVEHLYFLAVSVNSFPDPKDAFAVPITNFIKDAQVNIIGFYAALHYRPQNFKSIYCYRQHPSFQASAVRYRLRYRKSGTGTFDYHRHAVVPKPGLSVSIFDELSSAATDFIGQLLFCFAG